MMGTAAAVLAWPINLCAAVATANVCALISGEWKNTPQQTRLWLLLGLLLLFAAASVMAALTVESGKMDACFYESSSSGFA